MAGSNYSLTLTAITKKYEQTIVIDNIDLELKQGEFVSLLGPSGSGKTTLLRIIAGLITPDRGSVMLRGEDISFIPPYLRNMGMVFQQYALFPHMSVEDNVAYGLKARKLPKSEIKERVAKYLQLVDLLHLSQRKPHELSGGQQQRVSLARALAVEPVVLLFDEPLSNLDARLKEQMLKEIRKLHRDLGFTAIYVTHDQNEALFLSDKIAVLNKGKIEQYASPEEIVKKPASAFVADFFGFVNQLDYAVLVDQRTAKIGNTNIPVGHLGSGIKVGDRGYLLLRLNAVNQITFVTEQKDTLQAKVLDSRYLGDQTELQLFVLNPVRQEMTIRLPQMLSSLPAEGTLVEFEFSPDGICFFKGEQVS